MIKNFSTGEMDEVFPSSPIREVAFEMRFSPRLRVNAELWKLQEQLVDEYPSVTTEARSSLATGAVVPSNSFGNPNTGRIITVTQHNLIIGFTKYARFEDFKAEVLRRVDQFCTTFEVNT